MKRPRNRVRLIDVAEHANVSLTTASFALSGRGGVSAKVAERIRLIADELGYSPNAQAQALAKGATSMIGLTVHQIDDPYFAEISASVAEAAHAHNMSVQICQTSADQVRELEQVRTLISSDASGIIVAGSGLSSTESQTAMHEELLRYQKAGGHPVVIGRHEVQLDAVTPDNYEGGKALGKYVTDTGHRIIGIATGPPELNSAIDRLRGVMSALSNAGVQGDSVIKETTAFTREGGISAAHSILTRSPNVTCIIALNDAMASGALAYLRRRNIRVPQEMSLTGFGDISVAADLGPGLTTYKIHLPSIGQRALELAIQPVVSDRIRHHIEGDLIVRGSVEPPRSSTQGTSDGWDVSTIYT